MSDLYSIRDPSPLSALSSLPPSPVTLGVSLSDYEPSESTTSTVERAPLTLGTGVHLSVRPTIMGTPSSMSFTVDGPSSTHRKRKRQVIDCILIPPHSMSVLPSKSTVRRRKFRESGMAMEKGGGDKDRTFSLEDNAVCVLCRLSRCRIFTVVAVYLFPAVHPKYPHVQCKWPSNQRESPPTTCTAYHQFFKREFAYWLCRKGEIKLKRGR